MQYCPFANLSSVHKKYLMALSGLILAAFVLVHMVGNALFFKGPDALNAYAHWLQHLPPAVLWGFRITLGLALYVHARVAMLLTLENRRARPTGYLQPQPVRASWASAHMGLTGSVLGLFILFHLLHFTVQCVDPLYRTSRFVTQLHGIPVHDVHSMMVHAFSVPWVSCIYLVGMAALGCHLQHGAWSAFQSLGLCHGRLRPWAQRLAYVYAWAISLGFASIPLAVMAGYRCSP